MPWPDFLQHYRTTPHECCPRCLKFARGSADRFKALAHVDATRID